MMQLSNIKSLADRLVVGIRAATGSFPAMSRRQRAIFAISCAVFPLLVVVLTVVLPLCTQHILPAAPVDENDRSKKNMAYPVADTVERLLIDENFFACRIRMAKEDSICLVIDLPSGLAGLDLHGCRVRNCRIAAKSFGSRIRSSKHGELTGWLSGPFVALNDWATIPKMPIKIKKAPRDSIEANKMALEPRPVEKEDVHFKLFCDRDLVIDIEQTQPPSGRWLFRSLASGVAYYVNLGRATFGSLLHGRLPRHDAVIRLKLDQEDARAIFRALPHNAEILVRM